MEFARRRVLQLAAAAVASSALPTTARAQVYPTRPVRIIVGFPAGGTTDLSARLIAQWLSERLGQQFIVENRPSAATQAATDAVVRAPADGYTLLMVTATNAVGAALPEKLNYDILRDIAPVAGTFSSPFVLEVHPALPVKSVSELIAYAKANPGKLNMASFGTNTISHLCGEMFKAAAGVDMLHVPYRGSAPMLVDLMSGQVQLAFDNLPASIEHLKAGELRPLAVTTAKRSEALPDVPAMAEILPDFELSAWIGVGAPKDTPTGIIHKLNTEINEGLLDPKIKARLLELSGAPLPGSPEDFGKLVSGTIEKLRKVIQAANIKPNE